MVRGHLKCQGRTDNPTRNREEIQMGNKDRKKDKKKPKKTATKKPGPSSVK